MIWYCLIRVDDNVAYLSVYESFRRAGIGSPIYEIDLSRCKHTKNWIIRELEGLMPIAPSSATGSDRKESKRTEKPR